MGLHVLQNDIAQMSNTKWAWDGPYHECQVFEHYVMAVDQRLINQMISYWIMHWIEYEDQHDTWLLYTYNGNKIYD